MEEGVGDFIPVKVTLWTILNRRLTIQKLKWLIHWHETRQDSWAKTGAQVLRETSDDREGIRYTFDMMQGHKEHLNRLLKQLENI